MTGMRESTLLRPRPCEGHPGGVGGGGQLRKVVNSRRGYPGGGDSKWVKQRGKA